MMSVLHYFCLTNKKDKSTHTAEDDNSKHGCNFGDSEAASAQMKAKEEKRQMMQDFHIQH